MIVVNALGHVGLALLAVEVSGGSAAALLPLPLLLVLSRPEITRISNFTSMNLREMWALPVFWWQVRPRNKDFDMLYLCLESGDEKM